MKQMSQKTMLRIVSTCLILGMFVMLNQHTAFAKQERTDIPMATKVEQTAPDTLVVTYDKAADTEKAVNPSNYWVKDMKNRTPEGIATLGRKDKLSADNSLKPELVTITPTDKTNNTFQLKFSQPITSGQKYQLIICYVTTPDAPDYDGDNGTLDFTGK